MLILQMKKNKLKNIFQTKINVLRHLPPQHPATDCIRQMSTIGNYDNQKSLQYQAIAMSLNSINFFYPKFSSKIKSYR